ncbi:MAG: DUF169 domain-containing protein [Acidimicrobiales bacterium]
MAITNWPDIARRLRVALHLEAPPIAIAFGATRPASVPAFDEPMSEPASDGRRGRVSAGCVFWLKATDRVFTTVPEDHGNCSVGRVTHGLATLGEVAKNDDVKTLLAAHWVGEDDVADLPSVSPHPQAITYGPLDSFPEGVQPEVVIVRINGRQLMVISDAVPSLSISGKPQCQIVAIAKEQRRAAASAGCALSRARMGMSPEEMTCAFPADSLAEIVEAIEKASDIDIDVARYAARDARRFAS